MSDHLSTVFERLPDAHPPRPFAAAEAVRRRGRRRARRQRAAAVAAVVVLTGSATVGSQVLLRQPETRVAAAPVNQTLVTAADLGPGSWLLADHATFGAGRLWYWAALCGDAGKVASLASQQTAEKVTYVDAPRQVTQTVERYAPGRAAANIADVRSTVAVCPSSLRLGIIEEGFAGQESLLVKVEEPGVDGGRPESRYVAVTRVADAVATVAPVGFGAAYTKELAGRAAARLS